MNELSNVQQSSPEEQRTSEQPEEPLVDTAKQALTRAASQTREQIVERVETKKEKTASAIGSVADALRGASANLKEAGPLQPLTERAADAIDHVAEIIEKRSVRDALVGVEGYARREPALFVGGAFAVGLLLGRFLRSSATSEREELHSPTRTAMGEP